MYTFFHEKLISFPQHPQTNVQRISDTRMGIGKKKVFLSVVVSGRELGRKVAGEVGWRDKKENVMKGLGRIKEDGHIAEG